MFIGFKRKEGKIPLGLEVVLYDEEGNSIRGLKIGAINLSEIIQGIQIGVLNSNNIRDSGAHKTYIPIIAIRTTPRWLAEAYQKT